MVKPSSILVTAAEKCQQPQGFFYILAIQVWEYFSYYGMRSLLVLYLTGSLAFTDQRAYSLYGAYTSMVYVTPILGGMLADRLFGYRFSVMLGAFLMLLGHIMLGFSGHTLIALYLALALIVCGYGLFKTNISCLLGRLYEKEDTRRESGFLLMYVGGNIGAIIAPILVGWSAAYFGWHVGFSLAGFGMAIGLFIFWTGRGVFNRIPVSQSRKTNKKKRIIGLKSWCWIGIPVAVVLITLILQHLLAGYVLIGAGIISLVFLTCLFVGSDSRQRQKLFVILLFMLFGLVFWAFDQQAGSSISLFIQRNIDRSVFGFTIPAASFQAINPTALLLAGGLIALMWKSLVKKGINPAPLYKLALGMMLLTLGFLFISFNARMAMDTGQASPFWVVIGMALIGIAELFVDPIALAAITRMELKGSTGTLAGIYMLVSGAIANYAAGAIATRLATASKIGDDGLTDYAAIYHQGFTNIAQTSAAVLLALFIVAFLSRRLAR